MRVTTRPVAVIAPAPLLRELRALIADARQHVVVVDADQVEEIVASKQVIYDGFKAAAVDPAVRDRAGILVDEAFGAALLRDAAAHRYITCVSTEKTG